MSRSPETCKNGSVLFGADWGLLGTATLFKHMKGKLVYFLTAIKMAELGLTGGPDEPRAPSQVRDPVNCGEQVSFLTLMSSFRLSPSCPIGTKWTLKL